MEDHMEDHMQDHVHNSDSAVSGLTSLSGDDDFERFMIERAREERRRLAGSGQAFRKARTHARAGLTMDKLERNATQGATGVQSPPSSSGSTRSDPAIHAPAGWGRKGRTSRDWMRSITRGDPPQHTPAPPDEATASPLSHKSFQQGPAPAARQDSSAELDLTFDMNEASMLVSTPYLPRNTKLDDVRAREQGLATARLETARSIDTASTASTAPPQRSPQASPARRLHRRTNSWQSLTKSLPQLGKENSPIAVYTKSVETLGAVARDVVASAERHAARPLTSRRSDSQDLLRRLARASNTPSPKATAPPRPHTDSSHPPAPVPVPAPAPAQDEAAKHVSATSTTTGEQQEQPLRDQRHDTPHDGTTPDVPSSAPPPDVDATPMPTEQQPIKRNPTTPHVMGGWVDTPGPRTAHKPVQLPRPREQALEQHNSSDPPPPRSSESPADREQTAVEQVPEDTPRSVPRPQLPSSALHALVQEARAHHDYGDDTMHSLEELLGPVSDNGVEDDTLQGLTLPTSAPRTEAERERHAETVHIHRLREHLRATETNVRDVGRGMRRLETLMEHSQNEEPGEKLVIVRNITTEFSPWLWFRSFFWDERIKTQRLAGNSLMKIWGGVTLFGILLTLSFIYWASETVAWYVLSLPIFILLSLD